MSGHLFNWADNPSLFQEIAGRFPFRAYALLNLYLVNLEFELARFLRVRESDSEQVMPVGVEVRDRKRESLPLRTSDKRLNCRHLS